MKHSQMYDELTGKIKGIYVMLALAVLIGVWTYMTGASITTFTLAILWVSACIARQTRNQIKNSI